MQNTKSTSKTLRLHMSFSAIIYSMTNCDVGNVCELSEALCHLPTPLHRREPQFQADFQKQREARVSHLHTIIIYCCAHSNKQ